MNYDNMGVDELAEKMVEIGVYHQWYFNDDLPEVKAALRKAVIREASVGVIEVKVRESGDDLSRPGDPNRIVTASEQFECQTWVPEGQYWLVKKATP